MFLLIFSALSRCAQIGMEESSILYLGESNISEILKDKSACLLLVTLEMDKDEKFKTISDFIAAGEVIGTRCFFGIMNGDRNYKFRKSQHINEEKSFYFFRNGVLISKYNGKSTTEGLIDFAMSRTGIPFKTFDDFVAAQDFIESNEASVVLYSSAAKGPIFDKYNTVADRLRDNITFGLCPDEELSLELDIEELPSLVLYRNKDGAKLFFPERIEDSSAEDIVSWIAYNMVPSFLPFALNNQKQYVGQKPVCLFFTPVDVEEKQKAFAFIGKLAAMFKNDLQFAQVDAVTGNRFMTGLGFSRYADPAVCVLDYKKKKPLRYLYDEEAEWTTDDVAQFLMDFLDGKLKPHIKSSALPQDNKGPVIEINTNTLEQTITQKKDVLVLYYENWDRVYIDFLPLYEELANKYSDKVLFTKINVAENDLIAGKQPKKTPCLILYNRDNQELVYKGQLVLDSIMNFISDEVDHILDL